jgi:hypothetical protein
MHFLSPILIALAITTFPYVRAITKKHFLRSGQLVEDPAHGRTPADPGLFFYAAICFSLVLAILFVALREGGLRGYLSDFWWWRDLVLILSCIGLIGIAFIIWGSRTWYWDENGLGKRGWFAKGQFVPWSEIAAVSYRTMFGSYVESRNGERLKWSRDFAMRPDLIAMAVRLHRPDLAQQTYL